MFCPAISQINKEAISGPHAGRWKWSSRNNCFAVGLVKEKQHRADLRPKNAEGRKARWFRNFVGGSPRENPRKGNSPLLMPVAIPSPRTVTEE